MKKLVHGGDIYSCPTPNLLDFSANINPLGMPDSVKRAIVENIHNYDNYPDPLCRELRLALSKHEQVPTDNIVCGNGAADIIYRIVLHRKPKKAMVLAPTFSEYEEALRLCACDVEYLYLPEKKGFTFDESIVENLSQELDMLFICNPNNPTGIPITKQVIYTIAKDCNEKGVFLVIDECFGDFLEDTEKYSMMEYLNEFPNLMILKAFTKIYAMAGIRLGYALCSDCNLIEALTNTLQPWSVSTVAAKCGVAALGEVNFVEKTKKLVAENREVLIKTMKELGLQVFASKANYVFFKSSEINLVNKLKSEEILIRSCENYVGLGTGYYRIAVKNIQDNKRFLVSLKKVLNK